MKITHEKKYRIYIIFEHNNKCPLLKFSLLSLHFYKAVAQ